MAMWRCPHCGTPQAETARCWVCRRSSTACGSCRHFRRSVAAQLGYCGLDRQRLALRGDEIRSCWEAPSAALHDDDGVPAGVGAGPLGGADDRTPVRRLEFIPVEPVGDAPPRARVRRSRSPHVDPAPPAAATNPAPAPAETRWSLWGDVEG
jgi:hypothetical protein